MISHRLVSSIGPIHQFVKMINVWAFFLLFAYSCIPPVASLLPQDGQGRPLPFAVLVAQFEGNSRRADRPGPVEQEIWRVGMNVMMQYCDHLASQNPPEFVQACTDKVRVIYTREFGNTNYENLVSGNNFPTADLNRYLKHIRQGINLGNIRKHLKEAMVNLGWSEICEYCNDQGNPVEIQEECALACDNDFSGNPSSMGQYNGRPPLGEVGSSSGRGRGHR